MRTSRNDQLAVVSRGSQSEVRSEVRTETDSFHGNVSSLVSKENVVSRIWLASRLVHKPASFQGGSYQGSYQGNDGIQIPVSKLVSTKWGVTSHCYAVPQIR